MTAPSIIAALIWLSIGMLFVDASLGLEAFIFGTQEMGNFYNGLFVLKFLISSLFFFLPVNKNLITLAFFLVAFQLFRLAYWGDDIKNWYVLAKEWFFLANMITGLFVGYVWAGRGINVPKYFPKRYLYAAFYTVMLIGALNIYLNLTGVTNYFGLGLQLYLITPFLYYYGFGSKIALLTLLVVLFTGKRGLLVVHFVQTLPSMFLARYSFVHLPAMLVTILVAATLGLLDRFVIFFDFFTLHSESNILNLLNLASSGRFMEIIYFISAMDHYPASFWLGLPVGYEFTLGYGASEGTKLSFVHLSFLNFVKIFGWPLGTLFCSLAIFLSLRSFYFLCTVRYDLGLCIFLGYSIASVFGAIVVLDVLYFVSFSYTLRFFMNFKEKSG